jgi:hypothetical protein
MWDDGQGALIGRIDHRLAVALSPLTGNVQLEFGVVRHHGVLLFRRI